MEEETKMTFGDILRVILFAIIIVIATFLGSSVYWKNHYTNTEKGIETVIDTIIQKEPIAPLTNQTLEQRIAIIRGYLKDNYIGELKEKEMLEGALKGYVSGLGDVYTEYLTKEEYEELMVNVTGDFVGIGIYMNTDANGNVIVVSTIEDSPAEEAGLQANDIIVSVDGESCAELGADIVSNRIKGKAGTKVKLEISRDGKIIEKEVERRKVVIKDYTTKTINGNIGYIKLSTFDDQCANNVEKCVDEFIEKGITNIIFDLRDNTGGIVDGAIDICELFIKKGGIIMRTVDKDQKEETIVSKNEHPKNVRLVVLTNGMSASASEITTAALKDNEVATIIGTTTYGKGVMQSILQIFNGEAGLKLTIEEFFTPNGDKIHTKGIEPHIVVEDDKETEEDEQLERAIQELNS